MTYIYTHHKRRDSSFALVALVEGPRPVARTRLSVYDRFDTFLRRRAEFLYRR